VFVSERFITGCVKMYYYEAYFDVFLTFPDYSRSCAKFPAQNEISDSHDGEYEDGCLLGRCAA
jgi:hypothetical protein